MIEGFWYGLVNTTGNYSVGIEEKMEDNVDANSDLCENCRCTCDQKWNPETVRSFYSEKIEPQQEG